MFEGQRGRALVSFRRAACDARRAQERHRDDPRSRRPTVPLYLPPGYLPQAADWLWRFVRAASKTRVREIAASLAAFFRIAEADQRQLAAEVGYVAHLRSNGQLHLYRSEAQYAKDALGWAIKQEHGMRLTRLSRAQIEEVEPDVSPDYTIGLFLENDHSVTDPHGYALAMARSIADAGVSIERADVRSIRPHEGGWRIDTGDTPRFARDVAIAAGAWSAQLLEPLGVLVPLETQRGYHVHVPESGTRLSRTVVRRTTRSSPRRWTRACASRARSNSADFGARRTRAEPRCLPGTRRKDCPRSICRAVRAHGWDIVPARRTRCRCWSLRRTERTAARVRTRSSGPDIVRDDRAPACRSDLHAAYAR